MARTATLVLDSSKISPQALSEIEAILYGRNGQPPRMPLPEEVGQIARGDVLILNSTDGTYTILGNALVEDPNDSGVYLIADTRVTEDTSDPGTYLIGTA